MSHPEHEAFAVEIPVNDPEAMEAFQEAMNAYQDSVDIYIDKLASELSVSVDVALDIWYLRSRSRWTQEMEDKIIAAAKSGNPIDSESISSGEWRG